MWQVNSSGIKSLNAPVPLSFSIPSGYDQTVSGGPILTTPSRVTFQLAPPLIIPKECNCTLTSASFCFSQPNIAGNGDGVFNILNGNNRISIQYDADPTIDFRVPLGLYSVTDLQLALNQIARDKGWITGATDLFILSGISATQKIIFTLNPAAFTDGEFPAGGIIISFPNPGVDGFNDSMGNLLGFPTNPADPNYTTITAPGPGGLAGLVSVPAPNVSNFANISAYNLYVSFLNNSYQNGAVGQLLYSFPIGPYTPNSVISYQPSLRFPVQCQSIEYSTVDIWTTDQSGNQLPWKYYQSPFSFSCMISKSKTDGSL
jgi:hypothetical protein